MAYDEGLVERVRELFADIDGVVEKKMFGGLSFMVWGNVCIGVGEDRLFVRVDKDEYEDLLKMDDVIEMDFTGKPLRGFLYVLEGAIAEDEDLEFWINKALEYNKKLPPK